MNELTLYFSRAISGLSLHHQTQNNKSKNPGPRAFQIAPFSFPPLKTFEKPFERTPSISSCTILLPPLKTFEQPLKAPRAFQIAPFSYLL